VEKCNRHDMQRPGGNGHRWLLRSRHSPDRAVDARQGRIELLREIKLTFPQIKVIGMSGGGTLLSPEFVPRLARKLGADVTVSKPVDAKSLLEAIAMALLLRADG
jgi:hypothetical protein